MIAQFIIEAANIDGSYSHDKYHAIFHQTLYPEPDLTIDSAHTLYGNEHYSAGTDKTTSIYRITKALNLSEDFELSVLPLISDH